MSEFSIIDEFFKPLGLIGHCHSTDIGIGDDGAVISCPAGKKLVVVTDTLVEGVHFPLETSGYDIAWKALAVNLSDLAAMGAEPAFYTLCLSLPQRCADKSFLMDFAAGLKDLASKYGVPLVGGDTTKSDRLTLTISAHGWVDNAKVLRRDAAQVGDKIYVSGNIGDGALALQALLKKYDAALLSDTVFDKFYRPEPRIKLGLVLGGIANAAIDISDGFIADLEHILLASNVSAEIDYVAMPFSDSMKQYLQTTHDVWLPLTGGDDYELCFTLPESQVTVFESVIEKEDFGVSVYSIGTIVPRTERGVIWKNAPNLDESISTKGYEHF
jgi:thiamine-monophosphate kinase